MVYPVCEAPRSPTWRATIEARFCREIGILLRGLRQMNSSLTLLPVLEQDLGHQRV